MESGSWTPVSGDAKAFTYWNGRAIVPVSWWEYREDIGSERNGSDAVVVDVDVDGALTEIGRVSHPEASECDDLYYEDELLEEELEAREAELEESGDAEAGFVRGPDDEEAPVTTIPGTTSERYCYTWTPEIQRSIIIGDDLYTLSEAGVRVNTFDGLDEITWIPFDRR
ncbi:MAG: beta-propeller domain-containing protein [Actinomycetota bacterium]